MFGRMMNSFYYGKSGKGDFKKEDLPTNRWQLFWQMLRIRLSALFRLNLMTVVVFLPLIIVIGRAIIYLLNGLNGFAEFAALLEENPGLLTMAEEQLTELGTDLASVQFYSGNTFTALVQSIISETCLYLIPCILITGPVQAGLAYVTRNWARDEHAFIWDDFKDAVKENWKQALAVSAITSVVPILLYVCWNFYGQMANQQALFIVPQILTVSLGILWCLGLVYMYPLIVTYNLKFKDLIKNGLLLAIARLPMTIGIRLVMLVLWLIVLVLLFMTSIGTYAPLFIGLYYILIGYSLTRFVFASYTNGVFDKFINNRIEGAKVNRGLADLEEDDEDEEETDEK